MVVVVVAAAGRVCVRQVFYLKMHGDYWRYLAGYYYYYYYYYY